MDSETNLRQDVQGRRRGSSFQLLLVDVEDRRAKEFVGTLMLPL